MQWIEMRIIFQVLLYLGEEMEEDDDTLADLEVQDGSTILLQPKLASGFMTHPNSVGE